MERNRDLFTATVTSQHTGILNSVTEPLLESAAAAATIPFDINLWHRRLGHHSYADVQKMIKDGLVVALTHRSSLILFVNLVL